MKPTVACLLILIIPASARELSPLEQARKIKPGAWIVVTLQDGTSLRGRLGQVTQDRLTIEQPSPGIWSSRELLFQDIRRIAAVKESSIAQRVLEDVFLIPVAVIFFTAYGLYCGLLRRQCDDFP